MAGLPMPTSCYVTCSPTAKMRPHLPTRISNERIHVGGCFFPLVSESFHFTFKKIDRFFWSKIAAIFCGYRVRRAFNKPK